MLYISLVVLKFLNPRSSTFVPKQVLSIWCLDFDQGDALVHVGLHGSVPLRPHGVAVPIAGEEGDVINLEWGCFNS